MHSGRAEFDARAVTASNTPSRISTALTPSRPPTSISSLTARENQRLERRVEAVAAPRLISPLLSTRTVAPGPNDLDFKRVLERLNRITVHGGIDSRKLVLTEEKSGEVILDYGERLFVRVPALHQSSPLTVSIKRTKGKLVTYVSKTVLEPMEALCDATFRGDIVSVSDSGPRFKSKNVYLAINALEDSLFSLRATFGRPKPALRVTTKLLLQDAEENDWMAMLPQPTNKTKSCKTLRNFIEENQQLKASPTVKDFTDRRETWNARRAVVLRRSREFMDMKKTKALSIINRREIQRLEREKAEREASIKAQKEHLEQLWFAFISFAVFIENIDEKVKRRKAEIAAENFTHSIAQKIQRKFRRLIGNHPPTIALLRCQHSIQLLFRCTSIPVTMKMSARVIHCLRSAMKNALIRRQFQWFHRAGKG